MPAFQFTLSGGKQPALSGGETVYSLVTAPDNQQVGRADVPQSPFRQRRHVRVVMGPEQLMEYDVRAFVHWCPSFFVRGLIISMRIILHRWGKMSRGNL